MKYALSGLFQALKREVHIRLFLLIAILVIALAFYLEVTKIEWILLLLCIALVISLELINSAIERICDLVMPENDPRIKYIKDVSAGAVLLISIFAAITGLMIFIPYLF